MILDLFREGQRFATQPAQPLPQRVVEALDVGGAAANVVAGGKVATVGLSAVPPLSVLPHAAKPSTIMPTTMTRLIQFCQAIIVSPAYNTAGLQPPTAISYLQSYLAKAMPDLRDARAG